MLIESSKSKCEASGLNEEFAVENNNNNNHKTKDSRFDTTNNKLYVVDPTHKDFRKVQQGHNKVSKRASG